MLSRRVCFPRRSDKAAARIQRGNKVGRMPPLIIAPTKAVSPALGGPPIDARRPLRRAARAAAIVHPGASCIVTRGRRSLPVSHAGLGPPAHGPVSHAGARCSLVMPATVTERRRRAQGPATPPGNGTGSRSSLGTPVRGRSAPTPIHPVQRIRGRSRRLPMRPRSCPSAGSERMSERPTHPAGAGPGRQESRCVGAWNDPLRAGARCGPRGGVPLGRGPRWRPARSPSKRRRGSAGDGLAVYPTVSRASTGNRTLPSDGIRKSGRFARVLGAPRRATKGTALPCPWPLASLATLPLHAVADAVVAGHVHHPEPGRQSVSYTVAVVDRPVSEVTGAGVRPAGSAETAPLAALGAAVGAPRLLLGPCHGFSSPTASDRHPPTSCRSRSGCSGSTAARQGARWSSARRCSR